MFNQKGLQKDTKIERTKRQEKQEKNTYKDPTTAENPKHPNKNPKTLCNITLHYHSNPIAFAPSRTKAPTIIIDIALKVMNFSIPFHLRSGDWDLKTLPLNHLSHDIQKNLLCSPQNEIPTV
jgi:hypothetical protein